jgi:hypothetical protein
MSLQTRHVFTQMLLERFQSETFASAFAGKACLFEDAFVICTAVNDALSSALATSIYSRVTDDSGNTQAYIMYYTVKRHMVMPTYAQPQRSRLLHYL